MFAQVFAKRSFASVIFVGVVPVVGLFLKLQLYSKVIKHPFLRRSKPGVLFQSRSVVCNFEYLRPVLIFACLLIFVGLVPQRGLFETSASL